jgi:hypothetical protein
MKLRIVVYLKKKEVVEEKSVFIENRLTDNQKLFKRVTEFLSVISIFFFSRSGQKKSVLENHILSN